MRFVLRIVAIAIVPACIGAHIDPAAAASFKDRWSIIPNAHAEQPSAAGKPAAPAPQKQAPAETTPARQPQSPIAGEPRPGPEDRSSSRSFRRGFSGKASFYSYRTGKTASGSSFDRNLTTAAHRSLPFGSRVRVTNLANKKSVVVTITDRGPRAPGRVLDLSLGAARALGITDHLGVVNVHAEVLQDMSRP
jgi:rare lipoprotein A (peptidoglycan hydrolase)